MENQTEKCAHPTCHCKARPDNKFCGVYCESQGEAPGVVCNCGHGCCDDTMPPE